MPANFTIPTPAGLVSFDLPAPKSIAQFEVMVATWLKYYPPTAEQVAAAKQANGELAARERDALREKRK